MDKYTATEQAFKHGYEKGYEAAKKEAESEILILKQKRANIFEIVNAYERGFAKALKWIPVSEPPKEIGYYLVTVKHWLDGRPVTQEAHWNTADWLTCEDHYEITPRVTHWMPLPEPPKEGE